MSKIQLAVLGASNKVRVPGLAAQAKPATAGATSISSAYKVPFPAGRGVVRALRCGILQCYTRDFQCAGMTCLSLRVQVQTPQGLRDITIGNAEGYSVFESLSTWQKLSDIPYDSSNPWFVTIQNEDVNGSANAAYMPWVEFAIDNSDQG